MPHAEIKAELHWHDIEVKAGKMCAGCKFELADSGVMVSMAVPGLDPVRPKTFCNGCFETMLNYWERNEIIKAVDVASTAPEQANEHSNHSQRAADSFLRSNGSSDP